MHGGSWWFVPSITPFYLPVQPGILSWAMRVSVTWVVTFKSQIFIIWVSVSCFNWSSVKAWKYSSDIFVKFHKKAIDYAPSIKRLPINKVKNLIRHDRTCRFRKMIWCEVFSIALEVDEFLGGAADSSLYHPEITNSSPYKYHSHPWQGVQERKYWEWEGAYSLPYISLGNHGHLWAHMWKTN